ncbi:BON domain-containing protein [Methylophaga nitratireducenticrescens]|uniref:Hyperosmotically inducible periplasmic protein n=2 Tax=Methylophaga nitratireducenticrescens TaxID=754476 RepID=I1XGM1_METNJ|nr:BON domain-containing protein [Methylophaga nitratireducenticrescens]AUZ83639.1 BON domain-containing protein [Methylophaga nitratireducenticrescens]
MKFKVNHLAILTAATLVTTPVLANDWQGEANDAWLDGKLETSLLLNTELNNFKIDTDIESGVAVLSGEVNNQTQKELAGEIAQNIEGISEVKNNLTVDENYRNEDNDDDNSFSRTWHDMTVTAGLKMELAAHDELEATAIDVSTDNGVVTLKGNVKNEAEKDLAVEMAKGYDKVVEVNDELVVTN